MNPTSSKRAKGAPTAKNATTYNNGNYNKYCVVQAQAQTTK
jgi:hypothetical protein